MTSFSISINQEEITRHEVNPRNDFPEPQAALHPSLKPLVQHQKTHALQPPISPPHIKKTELRTPKKPPSQSSLPTKPRPKKAVREPTYLKDYIRNWIYTFRPEKETETWRREGWLNKLGLWLKKRKDNVPWWLCFQMISQISCFFCSLILFFCFYYVIFFYMITWFSCFKPSLEGERMLHNVIVHRPRVISRIR